jgi:hypothetical protein
MHWTYFDWFKPFHSFLHNVASIIQLYIQEQGCSHLSAFMNICGNPEEGDSFQPPREFIEPRWPKFKPGWSNRVSVVERRRFFHSCITYFIALNSWHTETSVLEKMLADKSSSFPVTLLMLSSKNTPQQSVLCFGITG